MDDYTKKHNEIKLNILSSLARSQKALSTIIENISNVTDVSKELRKQLVDNIEVISHYQRVLAIKLMGIHIVTKNKGRPMKPWLHHQVKLQKST